ncbi:MAG TPA: PilZ domain-containing protein [Sphingomonas sp.]|jgi:hypothetical protein|nr:PilZ domain-containing protein [Sphingomonas sp.]
MNNASHTTSAAARTAGWVERAERQAAGYIATISGPTIRTFDTRVINRSASGMLIDLGEDLQIGDVVTAMLPDRKSQFCQVVRLRDRTAGLRFI